MSSRTASPAIDFAVPPLNSRAPLIGKEELRGAALRRRVERALPAVTTLRAVKGEPSWNVTPRRRWKVYVIPSGVTSQRSASAGFDLGVGVEARQTVEEVADGATGGNVGRERGIERTRIVLVARVDDLVARRCAAGGPHPASRHPTSTGDATKVRSGRMPSIDTGKVARELTRSRRQASIRCARRRLSRAGALHVGTAANVGW